MRLVVQIGHRADQQYVVQVCPDQQPQITERHKDRRIQDPEQEPRRKDDQCLPVTYIQVVRQTFEADVDDKSQDNRISQQYGRCGEQIIVHRGRIRQRDVSFQKCLIDPCQNRDYDRPDDRIDQRILRVSLGPVVMDPEQVPVIYDQYQSCQIQGERHRCSFVAGNHQDQPVYHRDHTENTQ